MTTRIPLLSLLGLGLIVAAPVTLAAPARAQDYPYQGRAGFTVDGTVTSVDTDRDRVILSGDNGRRYTLDTYQTNIVLRDRDKPGTTGDLIPGMRLHVTGSLLSQNIIEADQVRVLALSGRPTTPANPSDADNSINLRGTVATVDDRRGSMTVHINTHERVVFLNDYTDIRGVGRPPDDEFPFRPGDRVTVSGVLRDDGTVLADQVSLVRSVDEGGSDRNARSLTGRVSDRSNRYYSRDIKIRVSPDHEVKIKVPSGIPVRRDGQPISVHDLTTDDVVRVYGSYDGDTFKASRIDVVQSYRDDGDD
jgi:hypothetical protein